MRIMSVERAGNFLPAGFAFVLLLAANIRYLFFGAKREGARSPAATTKKRKN